MGSRAPAACQSGPPQRQGLSAGGYDLEHPEHPGAPHGVVDDLWRGLPGPQRHSSPRRRRRRDRRRQRNRRHRFAHSPAEPDQRQPDPGGQRPGVQAHRQDRPHRPDQQPAAELPERGSRLLWHLQPAREPGRHFHRRSARAWAPTHPGAGRRPPSRHRRRQHRQPEPGPGPQSDPGAACRSRRGPDRRRVRHLRLRRRGRRRQLRHEAQLPGRADRRPGRRRPAQPEQQRQRPGPAPGRSLQRAEGRRLGRALARSVRGAGHERHGRPDEHHRLRRLPPAGPRLAVDARLLSLPDPGQERRDPVLQRLAQFQPILPGDRLGPRHRQHHRLRRGRPHLRRLRARAGHRQPAAAVQLQPVPVPAARRRALFGGLLLALRAQQEPRSLRRLFLHERPLRHRRGAVRPVPGLGRLAERRLPGQLQQPAAQRATGQHPVFAGRDRQRRQRRSDLGTPQHRRRPALIHLRASELPRRGRRPRGCPAARRLEIRRLRTILLHQPLPIEHQLPVDQPHPERPAGGQCQRRPDLHRQGQRNLARLRALQHLRRRRRDAGSGGLSERDRDLLRQGLRGDCRGHGHRRPGPLRDQVALGQ